jgi:hypothetical protein
MRPVSPFKEEKEGSTEEVGPYARFDPDKIHNSLTAGSLRGPGKLAVPPLVFSKEDESEAIGEPWPCYSIRGRYRPGLIS